MTEHRLEFTLSENPWAPTAVIEEINERTGSGLELVGLAEQVGGVSSAAYVRWPDGRECALTRTSTPLGWMLQTANVLSALRSQRLPVPRHDLVIELADGYVAVVQERLPGKSPTRVDADVIDTVFRTNETFAGLLANRPDVPIPPFHLRPDGPEAELWHETIGSYSKRSRRLLDLIEEIGSGEPYEMTGNDLLHTDYNLGSNILLDEHGEVTGVVDWNFGVARGDRHFALLGLRLNLVAEGEYYGAQPDAIERLDEILMTTIGPDILRVYWAGRILAMVYKSISNHFPAERIDGELLLGERLLTKVS